jgi:hypothetical protein
MPCRAQRSFLARLRWFAWRPALPKGRSEEAQAALATLVDEAKRSAVVQKAIDAKGLKGMSVATK